MTADRPTDLRGIAGRSHLSFSQLNVFHDCGLKYDLSYVSKAPRRASGAFIGGIATHKAIEISEREGWWVDAENFASPDGVAIEVFETVLHDKVRDAGGEDEVDWAKGGGEALRWWEITGASFMRRYAMTRQAMASTGWGAIDETEIRFDLELEGVPVPITGYLDKFLMHEGGEPLILDWKTGRIGSASPLQFATYARMIEAARGITVERGVAVFLRANDSDRRVQDITFADLRPRIDELYAHLATSIDAGTYLPNPGAWHSSCSVRESCWYWKATEGKDE